MTLIKTKEIAGHKDFELNIDRASSLTYHIAYDDKNPPKGIVFNIPGFGADQSIDYQKNIIKNISEEYNCMVVFVEYHALFSRPSQNKESATIAFSPHDTEILIEIINYFKIELDEDKLDFNSICRALESKIGVLKACGEIPSDFVLDLWATLYPYKNEYQTFGILQALDILTVLYDIKNNHHQGILEDIPVVAVGSSHGGYIANLLLKIAPNTFDMIIDNSCYTKPPMRYIAGFNENFEDAEFLIKLEHLLIKLFTFTLWDKDKNSINQFTTSHYEIRNLLDKDQLIQLESYNSKTKVVSYHSIYDAISSYKDKQQYMNTLCSFGVDTILNTISEEDQIDGVLIKNLQHSMGMSIKSLMKYELAKILDKPYIPSKTDLCNNSTIIYITGASNKYSFCFNDTNIKASCDNKRNF